MGNTSAEVDQNSLASSVSPFQRNLIMVGAMAATLMQVIDATIANVAIPHMQTSLNATPETTNWILTSYLIAEAVTIPITGWLADRVGRKRLYLAAILCFTGASLLCSMATTLTHMLLSRALQGVSGAFISPIGQAVLLDIHPPDQATRAVTAFGLGTLLGPMAGPMLGGWLAETFNWRWIFLINIPIGLVSLLLVYQYLPSSKLSVRRFDFVGFGLLVTTLGALQLLLDRGNQLGWLESWEICVELGIVVAAGWMFVVHLVTTDNPLFNLKVFVDPNFSTAVLYNWILGVVIMGGAILVPSLLQRLLGYNVIDAGMLTTSRGFGTCAAIALVMTSAGRFDPRLLIVVGAATISGSLWFMTGFNLEVGQASIFVSGFFQGFGMGLCAIPLSLLAFATVPQHLRTSAASMMSLTRSLGGSLGISITTTALSRAASVSYADLSAHITEDKVFQLELALNAGGHPLPVLSMLAAEVSRQSDMIAYIDDFKLMMWMTVLTIPFIFLLRRSPPQRP